MTSAPFDERLEQILATTAKVFAAKGFHPTTMRDLSRATGMSLAGLYHYIPGKEELLYLIQERCFQRVIAGAASAVSLGTSADDRLERFIRHHVAFFARHMSEMKVLSHEANSLTGKRLADINALKRRYFEMLRGLTSDVESDHAAHHDPHVAAYALFGMMNWIYNWYNPAGPLPPEALAERFAQLFMFGLTSPAPSTASHGG
ncbi:MAG: TetR/AcrR family transcriptional regulator [Gemmatimonadetes bacterium]|nr:TetR/AcrR family transcriptional regulator [Gemmatimonadota bacterium]